MLLFLFACAAPNEDSASEASATPWCAALQGAPYAQIEAYPAGNNGPEVYEPLLHQEIALSPQGGDLYTGSLSYTPPQAGAYWLAFGSGVDVLLRTDDLVGETASTDCVEVASRQSFTLEAKTYHLQLSDVSEPTLSFVGSGPE